MRRVPHHAAGIMVLTAIFLLTDLPAQPLPDGPEYQVNLYTRLHQWDAQVARLASGEMLVVWVHHQQPDLAPSDVTAVRLAAEGSPMTGEFAVNSQRAGMQWKARIEASSRGDYVVVWQSPDGDGDGAFARKADGTGSWMGPEFRVNTSSLGEQSAPHAAMDGNGNFTVVWISSDGVPTLQARRFDGDGLPVGQEFQVDSPWGSPIHPAHPDIDLNDAGDGVIIWTGPVPSGDAREILGRRVDGTGAFVGSEFQVNSYTPYPQVRPQVSVNASGEFIVAWNSYHESGGSYSEVMARRFDSSGSPQGDEFLLPHVTVNFQYLGDIHLQDSGEFIASYRHCYVDPNVFLPCELYVQEFDAGGARIGSPIHLNTLYMSPSDAGTQIAWEAEDDFTVVYPGEDGSYTGVFSRDFSPCAPSPGFVADLTASVDPGNGMLALSWSAVSGGDQYHLYEDTDPGGPFTSLIGVFPGGTTTASLPMPPGNAYYLAATESFTCGLGPKGR